MIEPAWIPVVAAASGAAIAFIGGLIGAGISYFNTRQQLRHQAKQEVQKRHLDKLEELSELIDQMVIAYMKAKEGVFKATSNLDVYDNIGAIYVLIMKTRMLSGIYAPELVALSDKVELHGKAFAGALDSYLPSENRLVKEFDVFQKDLASIESVFEASCREMQAALINSASWHIKKAAGKYD